MKNIFLILYSLLNLVAIKGTAATNLMYDKANQLYHNKNYDSASQLYQQMINDGYCYANLYYNAGNAYYRLNKIGLAVWSYEMALKLKHSKLFGDNLALAKKRIKEPIEEISDIFFIRWWRSLYQLFSANSWALLSLLFFLSGFFILFLKKIKQNFLTGVGITSWLFILSGYCLGMMIASVYNQSYHYQAIIIEPNTMFKMPSKKEPIFISEGIKVKVVDTQIEQGNTGSANYILVKLPDGREGRIERKAIKKL